MGPCARSRDVSLQSGDWVQVSTGARAAWSTSSASVRWRTQTDERVARVRALIRRVWRHAARGVSSDCSCTAAQTVLRA
jgi:hypothetical protein